MESSTLSFVKQKLSADFECLPGYAAFILHHALPEFAEELIRMYVVNNLPVLRFLKELDEKQLAALTMASQREMLTLIAANKTGEYINKTISSWLNNEIPVISREQVDSQDITLGNYVKGSVLRKFLTRYSSDPDLSLLLVEEIDRFISLLNSEMFSSYMTLQQQEIQKMNERLTKREQQLLDAQEIGQVGSFEWDFLGKQSSYTPQMFKIFEMDGPSNLQSFLEYVHPEDKDRVRKAIEKALIDGDYECEYRYIRNNREKVIYSRGKVQFKEGQPARMLGTIMDVTERHNIVKRLQESEALHKQAQALTHIGNWSWTIAQNSINWSDEMYRIYGLEPQSEAITFERFISFIHPDDRSKRISEIQKSLQTLKVEEYHFRIIAADGSRKILRGKGEVVAAPDGTPGMMLGTCQDVTREFTLTQTLKEREKYLEQLNQSLHAANLELTRTNEELESFNFIASHDLQEPLRKIQIYSNRILESGISALAPPLPDYFTRINNASRRMQKLIEDFLAFSQTLKANQVAEATDLNKVVDEIKAELTNRIEERKAKIISDPLPLLHVVPFQIKQLMINLLSNSLKYAKENVPPEIRICGAEVRSQEVPFPVPPGVERYLKVSVIDNGIGFEPRYKEKIFELFQRLHGKDEYSGTGIGLALCRKIVEGMKGYIHAESEPGKGSVFTFYVPQTRFET